MANKRKTKAAKRKQSQPKAARASGRTQMPKAMAMNQMSLVHQACSVTNPFCPEAVGARWPDNSYTRSVSLFYKNNQMLSTDTSGNCSQLFMAMETPCTSAGVVTGSSASFTTISTFNGVSMSADVSRFRVTSIGYKISCTSARMTTQGRLRLRLMSPMAFASLSIINTATQNVDSALDIPLARLIDKDIFVTCAPLGDVARLFQIPADYPTTATIANGNNMGWQVLMVSVDGMVTGGATPCVNVELYAHYEQVYTDSSSTQLLASTPPPNNPAVQQASASVIERIGGIVETTANQLDRFAKSAAAKYFAAGAAMMIGGPAAGAATYGALSIRDVD